MTSVNKHMYPSSEIIVITATGVKPVPSPLLTLSLVVFTIGQQSRYHYNPHFILSHSRVEESEAYVDEAIFPRPHNKKGMHLDHKPRFIWFQGRNFLFIYLFIYLFIIFYTAGSYLLSILYILVYMSIPISQFITPPPLPLSPLGVHTFVLCICVSTSALQTGSSVPFF